MVKHRLIATLLVHNGQVVQTRKFKPTNVVGNPFTAVDFFNAWSIDEIVILEISRNRAMVDEFVELVAELSRRCFVPLSVGGKIADLDLVGRYTRAGADKVVVNTEAVRRPELITEIADSFGSQCVVLSIDARPDDTLPSGYRVVIDNGREDTSRDLLEWVKEAVDRGAGEFMVNSLENDGDKRGYDLALVRRVAEASPVPVIAMGGVGSWQDFADGLTEGQADAVAAGNIFHYTEHSTKAAKQFLFDAGLYVRTPCFYSVKMPRRPKYRAF